MNFKFKQQNPDPTKRKAESQKIKEKYEDRVPIICEKDPKSKLSEIDKNKYLVPSDLTVSQFSFIIRKRLALDKSSALFLLVNGKISITGDSSLGTIYEAHKDQDDGFLYISYTGEIIWGNDNNN
jgi:GABA(A) receptor-associated protein